MADHVTPQKRSEIMAKVRSKDTTPEKRVRSLLHRMGYRFRLHTKNLPGKPDIVLPRHNVVIFVHGCFWHRHKNCRWTTTPRTRVAFWNAKFESNKERDARNARKLRRNGWRVITIWQCQTNDTEKIERKLRRVLDA